jgi:hypothetical protein
LSATLRDTVGIGTKAIQKEEPNVPESWRVPIREESRGTKTA